jgi:murein DD-endopeptidase MepM/ murein hydrolase activator NlpD
MTTDTYLLSCARLEGMMNKKEKLRLIAASAFVLSALTLTGIYMSASDSDKQDNSIDFAKLEQQNITSEKMPDLAINGDNDDNNDMDVDPAFTEANSPSAINDRYGAAIITGEATDNASTNATLGTDKAAVFMEEKSLSFSEGDSLVLPIIGDVIMDYSMDGAVYHETMQQYRYSPALIIAATEGETVTAALDAKVTDIYSDAQTGKTICFDIGGGYELTYGQLDNIQVNVGDYVSTGDIVASIASPTIYYSEEGANIYYKLTKDGEPVDPLFREKDN